MTTALFQPSANIELLRESATIAVSQQARALKAQGRRIVDLGAGEPDFDTPAFIREAGKRALDQGHTRYTATDGVAALREAIAAQARGHGPAGGSVTAADVVVSNGSKQSLFNACFVLFGPGDEVLVPTPSWTSYYEMVQLARAVPVPVYGDADGDLKVTAAMLAAQATERTRGIMLNSPCNPTGAVYSPAELRDILSLAQANGWWVISDEIYRRIAYEEEAASTLAVAVDRDNLIVVDGVAKAYAMTGWRVGWAIAPREVARAMTAFQSHATFHTAAVSQQAALAALTDHASAEAEIAAMVARYRLRRDAAVEVLSRVPGLRFVRPSGAFYLYADVGPTANGADDAGGQFARELLEAFGVAVVPGAAFKTPDWIRMSYATDDALVVEGAQRIGELYVRMRA
jgi:aspartate aminotransferase